MPNYLEIAKLRSHNFSQRSIASSLNLSRNTVSNVFAIMDQNQIGYEDLQQMTQQQIHNMFVSKKEEHAVYFSRRQRSSQLCEVSQRSEKG